MLLLSAAHRAVPACSPATLPDSDADSSPAVPQTREGAEAGPGHIGHLCVYTKDMETRHKATRTASMGAEKPGRVSPAWM